MTRRYRAPELILLCPYSAPVDIWSVGCVLAELLDMLDDEKPVKDRNALFRGNSCPVLSPRNIGISHRSSGDQLDVILRVLGTPSAEDIEALNSTDAAAVIEKYPVCAPKVPASLKMLIRLYRNYSY